MSNISVNDFQTDASAKIGSVNDKIDKLLSNIDVVMSLLNNKSLGVDVRTLIGSTGVDEWSRLGYDISPFDIIVAILKKTGTYDKVIEFIGKMLSYELPAIELVVKMAILANVKGMISCASNPLIPKYLRKSFDNNEARDKDFGKKGEMGIYVNVGSIDFTNLLLTSPLSEEGKYKYFGFTEGSTIYSATRAYDFNAFLWYAIHRSDLPNPINVGDGTLSDFLSQKYNCKLLKDAEFELVPGRVGGEVGDSVVCPFVCTCDDLLGGFIPGVVLKQGNQMALCVGRRTNTIEPTKDEQGVVIKDGSQYITNYFVPIGNYTNCAVWYPDSGSYWSLRPSDKRQRNCLEENGICCIEYVDSVGTTATDVYGLNNKFHVSVLPGPYMAKPDIITLPWNQVKMTFNRDGVYDEDGYYTINPIGFDYDTQTRRHKMILGDDETCIIEADGRMYVADKDGNEKPEQRIGLKYLYQCYPKKTVYEFNYDFVMGMQLFDGVALTARLIELFGNTHLCGSFDVIDDTYYNKIVTIIRDIVDADDTEASDCYFNFSNDRFDEMMNEAENRRFNRIMPGDGSGDGYEIDTEAIKAVLSEYDVNGDLVKNADVIQRALTTASVAVQPPKTRATFGLNANVAIGNESLYNYYRISDGRRGSTVLDDNVIKSFLENMAITIVENVITPKIVLLLEVNRQLMRSNDKPLTLDSFMEMMMGIIISVVKEIKDYLLKELLKWVEKLIIEFAEKYGELLLTEQVAVYASLFAHVIATCIPIAIGKEQASTLANVNYADIKAEDIEKLIADCK